MLHGVVELVPSQPHDALATLEIDRKRWCDSLLCAELACGFMFIQRSGSYRALP